MNNRLQEKSISKRILLEHFHCSEQEKSHVGSLAYFGTLHQKMQLFFRWLRLSATSIPCEYPHKPDIPFLDPPCRIDVNQKPWRRYLFEYYYDGSWWGFDIAASSVKDAQDRINKMCFAKYVGEHRHTIKIKIGGSVLLNLFCFVRNFFRRSTVFRT